ncbi:cytochrome P450 [Panaeolus papilionaceus]|nr:cytochrome P450 [Panaeolus papilionaceus]
MSKNHDDSNWVCIQVFTLEPDHVKAILATQFDSFEKGPVTASVFNSLLGVGIFNSDGEMWKFHRAMTRPFFTKERISDFEIYTRNCDRALDLARSRLAEGYSFDFQDLVGRFTLDSASEFLFGYNVDSLAAGISYPKHASHKNHVTFHNHPSNSFLHAFNQGQHKVAVRGGGGRDWPFFEFWKDEIVPLRKQIDAFTEPILKEALEKREQRLKNKASNDDDKNDEEENTLLAHLVNHTQDPKILMDELVNLLVAGRDTTMSLLTFSVYMLIENPHIEHKLRKEIYEKVGSRKTPTYGEMRDMRYMRAFLNEVLRLYPSVLLCTATNIFRTRPLDGRRTNKGVVLTTKNPNEAPIYISAGTGTTYSVFYMHRRKDLWGPDALEFDPDRFLDHRLHKYLTPNPYIFCPFNAGPRICLGQQFAYHEATFYLVRLLQQFTKFKFDENENIKPPEEWSKMEGPQGRDRVVPNVALTMSVKGGLWMTMEELKAEDA